MATALEMAVCTEFWICRMILTAASARVNTAAVAVATEREMDDADAAALPLPVTAMDAL